MRAQGLRADRGERRGAGPGRYRARLAAGRAESTLEDVARRRVAARAHRRRVVAAGRSTTRPTSPRWPSSGRAPRSASATSCTPRARSASAAAIPAASCSAATGGFGGEFGHTAVEPDGLPCACGSRGCLETPRALSRFSRPRPQRRGRPSRGSGRPWRARPARPGAGSDGAAPRSRLRPLARHRARHRRQSALAAGDRPRRALRADDRVARTGHPGRALLAGAAAATARSRACSLRRWARRPRCAAPPPRSCGGCSRTRRSSRPSRRRRGGRRRLSVRPRSRPSSSWERRDGRFRCCSRRSGGWRS